MALSPDDVVNKRFQTTKFRDGYDQDEVDDFLDEVVGEFRRLIAENEALTAKVAELESAPVADAPVAAPVAAAAPAPVPEPVAAPAETAVAPAAPAAESSSLLALAQKLHDEHVAEGARARDELIAEATTKADEIVSEAKKARADEVAALDKERTDLQAQIDGLRVFEREYRTKLRGYIEAQLNDLNSASTESSISPR